MSCTQLIQVHKRRRSVIDTAVDNLIKAAEGIEEDEISMMQLRHLRLNIERAQLVVANGDRKLIEQLENEIGTIERFLIFYTEREQQ